RLFDSLTRRARTRAIVRRDGRAVSHLSIASPSTALPQIFVDVTEIRVSDLWRQQITDALRHSNGNSVPRGRRAGVRAWPRSDLLVGLWNGAPGCLRASSAPHHHYT